MSLKAIQEKINSLALEAKAIAEKADATDADYVRLEEISAERPVLEKKMAALKAAGEFGAWASQSAGMLPLAGTHAPAAVPGMKAAGETVLESQNGSILVNSEGEGLVDEKTLKLLRNPDYTKAFKSYLRHGIHGMTESRGLKVLQEGSDTAGGFLVPEEILARIIAKEPAPTRITSRVSVFNTSRDAMVLPKVNYSTDDIYSSGMRVTWTGEVPASATTHRATEPVFGQARIPVFTAMMSLPLTNDLVEDSASDIVGFCTSKFSETNELLRGNMAINGTGVGQPSGILVNPNAANNPATVASGAAAALTWAGLSDLAWSLPEQYEDNAVHVMNKTSTGKAIAQLVDGDGRPLWKEGSQDSGMVGSPKQRTLNGYPVLYDAFMPNVAASAYPIIFGDLRGYAMVNRVGFSMQVLRELYAETNQILLLGRVRFGGLVLEEWRIKVQVVSAS